MPSPNDSRPLVSELRLPQAFAENRPGHGSMPLGSPASLKLDSPSSMALALPAPDNPDDRPRILFADDDHELLQALQTSADAWFNKALHIRSWSPHLGGLVEHVQALAAQDWRPDLVVLDINFDEGGKGGIEYLRELRSSPGLVALPVVLATGNLLRDLDLDRVTDLAQPNRTRHTPKQWLVKAKAFEPEAILYGKTGDAGFLLRLGENLPVWREAARRRTWNALLGKVALLLDGRLREPLGKVEPGDWYLEDLGQLVADHLHGELAEDQVFVRWRMPSGLYQLIGVRSPAPGRDLGHPLDTTKVPLLAQVMRGGGRAQLDNGGVKSNDAGELDPWITNMKFLGVGSVLNGECVGFVTLLRDRSAADFDDQIDAKPLELLARLLASAVGRASRLNELRERERRLLDFANQLANAEDEAAIAQQLALLLHEVLHEGADQPDDEGEVSVRLVNFSTGAIMRAAHVGRDSADKPIWLWTQKSVFQRTIVEGQAENHADTQAAAFKDQWLETGLPPGYVHSELCVPMRVGKFAIGAANAEHHQHHRYNSSDQRFAESAATLTSAAIMRLRARGFMLEMARFASNFATLNALDLRASLTQVLEDFSGASAVVWMSAGNADDDPWQVQDVVVHLEGGDPGMLRRTLHSIYTDSWAETRLGQWVLDREWEQGWSKYADSGGRPAHLRTPDSPQEAEQFYHEQSVAVLWRRPKRDARPIGAVLLLWLFAPPLVDSDIELLGRLAQLWSGLEAREEATKAWMHTALLGEQAAALGHVMQHFQHRLRSDLGAFSGLYERMQLAIKRADLPKLQLQLNDFRHQIEVTGSGFDKSVGYIKAPQRQLFELRDSVLAELTSHTERVARLNVALTTDIDETLQCDWDEDVFQLTLFTLIENALDEIARASVVDARIHIHARSDEQAVSVFVDDNGPGVVESIKAKLFEFGTTTKSNGLGSALAFARMRMRILKGDLRLGPNRAGPLHGASFEIRMPHDLAGEQQGADREE